MLVCVNSPPFSTRNGARKELTLSADKDVAVADNDDDMLLLLPLTDRPAELIPVYQTIILCQNRP
jgi:hypothetical protein